MSEKNGGRSPSLAMAIKILGWEIGIKQKSHQQFYLEKKNVISSVIVSLMNEYLVCAWR
jgi:hypothetical protein